MGITSISLCQNPFDILILIPNFLKLAGYLHNNHNPFLTLVQFVHPLLKVIPSFGECVWV